MDDRVKKTAAAMIGATVLVAIMGVLNFDYQSTDDDFVARRGHPTSAVALRGQQQTGASNGPGLGLNKKRVVRIPPSLDISTQRRLSLNLGGGACEWEPPEYDVPTDISFFKTVIAGFPSCDKRMTFTQMEALTGWPARDEWDFIYKGPSNHPFIKSNYPHHEGYWTWGDRADQVVLVVRNMRKTMVEYHDILWDIASAKVSGLAYNDVIYKYRPPIDTFFEWRDRRVMEEVHWYGWFIDYWIEGGEC